MSARRFATLAFVALVLSVLAVMWAFPGTMLAIYYTGVAAIVAAGLLIPMGVVE